MYKDYVEQFYLNIDCKSLCISIYLINNIQRQMWAQTLKAFLSQNLLFAAKQCLTWSLIDSLNLQD